MGIFLNLPSKIWNIGNSCKRIIEVLPICAFIQDTFYLFFCFLNNFSLCLVSLKHHFTIRGLYIIEFLADASFNFIEFLYLLVYIPKGKNRENQEHNSCNCSPKGYCITWRKFFYMPYSIGVNPYHQFYYGKLQNNEQKIF